MKHGRGIISVRISNLHIISPSSEKNCPATLFLILAPILDYGLVPFEKETEEIEVAEK